MRFGCSSCKSSNIDEISQTFTKNLYEIFQMTIVNDIHKIGIFLNDILNDNCERHHSQIPTIL